ncbi:unnamed protein product [Urochloa humidicola]
MATRAELEEAVAALRGKRSRLREAFDRLAACTPFPVPFRWEDLDAHLASVVARFGLELELESPTPPTPRARPPLVTPSSTWRRMRSRTGNVAASGSDDEPEEGELPRPHATSAIGSGEAAPTSTAAAASADPSALAGLLWLSGRHSLRARREFLPSLLAAADPHALLLRTVGRLCRPLAGLAG